MMRLLGDMRSYNYVVVPIHDFDNVIYKIRAIDFKIWAISSVPFCNLSKEITKM